MAVTNHLWKGYLLNDLKAGTKSIEAKVVFPDANRYKTVELFGLTDQKINLL